MKIEDRGGVPVLVYDVGCRPATDGEVYFAARLAVEEAHGEKYQRELAELRTRLAEAEALLREIDDDLEIGAHPQLHRERIRAYFAPDSATTREDEHE